MPLALLLTLLKQSKCLNESLKMSTKSAVFLRESVKLFEAMGLIDDWGGPTVTEFRGPHGMEEGKGERYLAPGRQYGNALLGVRHQEEDGPKHNKKQAAHS